MNPTIEQINNLRDLFTQKLGKEGAPCEGGFHPDDVERIKSDRWLQLFLEQTDLDMNQAISMLWETCTWRKTYGTNEITENTLQSECLHSGIIFPRNKDLNGKNILIFKAKLHTKGTRDLSDIIKVLVYWIERLNRQTNYDQITLFFDMQSAGMSNMDMDLIKRMVDTFKLYYPNSLNYIMIFEMPWILNAAFKIIKGLLPPKAVARMKFVNSKSMKEFISEDNMLKAWGGTDDYVFHFVSEQQMQSALSITKEASSGSNGVPANTRKVHFATFDTNREISMSELSSLKSVGDNDDAAEILQLKPDDAIVFATVGNATMGTVQVNNVSQKHVSYKIKTTSPDKFRVRPSAGILSPTQKTTIHVLLQQGNVLSQVPEDKFLVMCMAISEEAATNDRAVAELWKNTPVSSPEVEQHRLLCSWQTSGDSFRKKNSSRLNAGAPMNTETERQIGHFNIALNQLSETTQRLEQQLKLTQILQWLTLLIFLVLCGGFIYIFRHDLNIFGPGECDKKSEL